VKVLDLLGEVQTVVDIGANRGQFALSARRAWPDARIVSFEPLPEPARKFKRVFGEDSRVTLHQVAIGDVVGEATMHVSRLDDSSSLLPITKEQRQVFPGTSEVGTVSVRVGRLAEFVRPDEILAPALLKIDVQGYELEALQGCEDMLSRFDSIYCECSFVELYAGQALAGQVVAWLADTGFDLAGIYNTHYDRAGRAIQADFLFRGTGLKPRTSDEKVNGRSVAPGR